MMSDYDDMMATHNRYEMFFGGLCDGRRLIMIGSCAA